MQVPPIASSPRSLTKWVRKARALGASVSVDPMDMPIGRFAGLIDPQGASFTVMQHADRD